ncbi:MAG TPA: phosphoadenylyl-sulfate reductase [Acidimicrobiales bacterium]|nr:phosphoadenylyl-sulfate reductase [Acidimicrobiales bacterium]
MTETLTLVDEAELAEISERFETASASAVMRWARDRFGASLVLASSFQDSVLIDVAVRQFPEIDVVFLDTGFHFPETLDYVETVRQRYDLNLRVIGPTLGPDEWPCGTDRCCELRKVAPLARALEGREAWMTGLRRTEAATRAEAPIVGRDEARGLIKVNPLATWSDQDVSGYVIEHGLPVHPLTNRGFASIGCAPTTRAVLPGEDPRAGRWSGTDKTECGIHV